MKLENLIRASYTSILGLMLIGPVLSPSYLAWIMPFVAFGKIPEKLLLLASLFLTMWYHNKPHALVANLQPEVTWALLLRNFILIILFLYSAYTLWKSR